MKKHTLVFFAILIAFISSCEKDDNIEKGKLTGKVTATIQGEEPFVSIPKLTKTQSSADKNGTLNDSSGSSSTIECIYEYNSQNYPIKLNKTRKQDNGFTTSANHIWSYVTY